VGTSRHEPVRRSVIRPVWLNRPSATTTYIDRSWTTSAPHARPNIGRRPTKLYRDLLTGGGRDGKPLAVPTVTHLHAVLRKAFRDAVIVDELIASNPVERAKRPRVQAQEPGPVWAVAQLRAFLTGAAELKVEGDNP
jgi:hypothetical protein